MKPGKNLVCYNQKNTFQQISSNCFYLNHTVHCQILCAGNSEEKQTTTDAIIMPDTSKLDSHEEPLKILRIQQAKCFKFSDLSRVEHKRNYSTSYTWITPITGRMQTWLMSNQNRPEATIHNNVHNVASILGSHISTTGYMEV